MKPIHYILICCILVLSSCTKEEEEEYDGRPPRCPCYDSHWIIVNILPTSNQSITIGAGHGPYEFGGCKISHSADTNTFIIPTPMVLSPPGTVVFTSAQLGFQFDSIADTIVLSRPNGTEITSWKHY